MKSKIKFDCLFESGKRKNLILEMEFPNFTEDVDSNIINHLNHSDFTEFKQLNNVNKILHYYIVENVDEQKRKTEYIFNKLLAISNENRRIFSEFIEIYNTIKKDIKYKSELKQINKVVTIYNKRKKAKNIDANLAMCIESALKYSTINDWKTNDFDLYSLAEKKGWLKYCTKHMNKISYARPFSDVDVERLKYYHQNSAFFYKSHNEISNSLIESRISGILDNVSTILDSNISEKIKYKELSDLIQSYSYVKIKSYNLHKEQIECLFAIFGLLLSKKWFDLVYSIEKKFITTKMIDVIISRHPGSNIYSTSRIPNYILLYLAFVFHTNEYKNFNIHGEMKKRILAAIKSSQFKELIQNKPVLATI